jgi:hypothetical protein
MQKVESLVNKNVKIIIVNIFIVLFFTYSPAFAQRDSSISYPLITVNYGFQIPGGDLSSRFGANSNVGLGFYYKTQSNWIFGLQWSFLFSNNVREDSLFKGVMTPEGNIIDLDGKNGDYRTMQRGNLFGLGVGRMFNVGSNKNSGIVTIAYLNALQHKIRVHNNSNNIPQINNEYKQGYDHLTNGLGTGLFLGYMYMSATNYVNIYAGADLTVAFTRNRRYNFNIEAVDNRLRYDILSGLRIGIILPLYSKSTDGKFFYD